MYGEHVGRSLPIVGHLSREGKEASRGVSPQLLVGLGFVFS